MLSLRRLMNNTPKPVQDRSKKTNARVIDGKVVDKRSKYGVHVTVRVDSNTEETHYDTDIEFYPAPIAQKVYSRPTLDTPIFVKCSCPFFLFHCEYALARSGSSEIDYSNGNRPVVKNPNQTPYLCKHLFRAAPEALRMSQSMALKNDKISFR